MAGMYETSDFRKNLKLEIDGYPWEIIEFQHIKPGKGNAFTRTRIRNMITGQVLERNIKSGEKIKIPDVVIREMQYLYKEGNDYTFMDTTNYEQITLPPDSVGDAKNYLIENLTGNVLFYNGKAIGIDLPNSVVLKLVQTDPAVKGNTVTGASKNATMETGLVIQVPLHMKEGDLLKVDTRTGNYIEKMNK